MAYKVVGGKVRARENETRVKGMPVMEGTPKQRMAAFDALGPEMRKVHNDFPVRVDSRYILGQAKAMGLDPRNPDVDGWMAADSRAEQVEVLASKTFMGRDPDLRVRSFDDFVLKPKDRQQTAYDRAAARAARR